MVLGEAMRAFFDVGYTSHGVSRVALNLAKYLPDEVTIATDPDTADLVVMHVNGRHNHRVDQARRVIESGRKYAVIQYALESTRNPRPTDWLDLWGQAELVWSYYDLREYIPNMYLAPLGADSTKFYVDNSIGKDYICGTLGNDFPKECYGEVRLAAFLAGERLVHVGDMIVKDPNCDNVSNISDDDLRSIYNRCDYFSALRRVDGFELVAAEAILCGSVPIMFDAPRFRMWFEDLAIFVPEMPPAFLVKDLRRIFNADPIPATPDKVAIARSRFDWEIIVDGFWNRILNK